MIWDDSNVRCVRGVRVCGVCGHPIMWVGGGTGNARVVQMPRDEIRLQYQSDGSKRWKKTAEPVDKGNGRDADVVLVHESDVYRQPHTAPVRLFRLFRLPAVCVWWSV